MAKSAVSASLQKIAGKCRVDTLVGAFWLCLPEILQSWVDTAWAIVENNELKEVQLRSAELVDEQQAQSYTVKDGIAQITMSGPMTKYQTSFSSLFGGVPMQQMREVLREIRADQDVRGVFVHADSPGGTAEGTAELADAIRKTASVKPLHVHAEDKACSGMLWVATQGSGFTAGPAASVGSQGVLCRLLDSSAIAEASGLKPVILTTGAYKGIGAPGSKITPEHVKELQRQINLINVPFKKDVVSARRLTQAQATEVATARVFIGDDAKRVGLVDRICSADEAYVQLLQKISTKTVVPVSGSVTKEEPVAASTRRKGMLKPEELSQVRQLPGGATVTEENADSFLFGALQASNQTVNSLTGQKRELEEKLRTATAQVVSPIDPKLAEGHIGLFCKNVDFSVKVGTMMPEQAKLIKDHLMPGNKPNVAAVSPTGEVLLDAGTISKVLELNKPAGLVGEVTGANPAVRQEPSKEGDPKPVTTERQNQLLGLIGQGPVSANGNGAAH